MPHWLAFFISSILILQCSAYYCLIIISSPLIGMWSIAKISVFVYLSVCLSVCPFAYLQNHTPVLYQEGET